MKLFDPDSYINIAITGFQAIDIAEVSDKLMSQASFVMYGEYDGKKYYNFSSQQKAKDTHVILSYCPKKLAD